MYYDLTKGRIGKCLILFALPMIAGNLLQQFYNIADTLIVGRVLGKNALAAVGSAYTLMTFLTSVFLGLSMGSGALFSIYKGKGSDRELRLSVVHAFGLIMSVTVMLNVVVYLFTDLILWFLRVPEEVYDGMKTYLLVIFAGLVATSLYNFFSCLLRALGNSTVPLVFLAVSAVLNIGLDLLFVAVLPWGIAGAAFATVIAQYVSGVGITIYVLHSCKDLLPGKEELCFDRGILGEIVNLSSLTCLQQSVMNFGILMIQGLINSFGTAVMAAYAAAVKIDSFAYMPAQEFSNSFSIFTSQNYGAKDEKRVKEGVRAAVKTSLIFCGIVSVLIFLFARPLMLIFVKATEVKVLQIGVQYLRIEGAFYCGIGLLFLLYAYYRGTGKPEMSVVLTVISLGTRGLLAYTLAPLLGVRMIWWAIIIGWFLADITGVLYMKKKKI